MDYTKVGKIINTHGIKGEVKVYPLTDNLKRFNKLKIAYLGEEKIKVELERVKYHKEMVIIKFKEFSDINDILFLKDKFIYVDDEERIILPEGRFFIFDILGCEVFDTKGALIGVVEDIIQSASNDVYIVKDKKTNKEYMIPAIKHFFIEIDTNNKKIIIDPIEGMIE